MFEYSYEKRPSSARSDDSRAPISPEWARGFPSASRVQPSAERARRPLPPRPVLVDQIPTKITVPLRVWLVAGASCLCVCAVLVLGTLALTRPPPPAPPAHPAHPAPRQRYLARLYTDEEPTYAPDPPPLTDRVLPPSSEELDSEIANIAILEKLSLFKNMVANRDRSKDLSNKPQIHPLHDPVHHPHHPHPERRVEKKDKPKPATTRDADLADQTITNEENLPKDAVLTNKKLINEDNLPDFKPLLPDLLKDIKLPSNYLNNMNDKDYEDYYNDENLYDDYMQSNSLTSYLIEKVQELHDWITKDPDFELKASNATSADNSAAKTEFSELLRALNASLLEGNVTIVMNKIRDLYFDDGSAAGSSGSSRRAVLQNSTDIVSFGILTLDVMLLHNIQQMAWESQEAVRSKMLKDPDVFAFNALFMEPARVEAKQAEILQHGAPKRARAESAGVFEGALQSAMSAARAALHLGRAYKNARNILSQLRGSAGPAPAPTLARREDNAHALQHLHSFSDSDSDSDSAAYSELDCVWLLYCRNLAASAKLSAPYGTMARINGMALRMLAGALSDERALDALLYEALAGWSDLDCDRMFPRCSKVNAAAVVLDAILQPTKKLPSKSSNRGR